MGFIINLLIALFIPQKNTVFQAIIIIIDIFTSNERDIRILDIQNCEKKDDLHRLITIPYSFPVLKDLDYTHQGDHLSASHCNDEQAHR